MAATNFTPISLYYSTTASAVPTSGNLVNGELALNTADMKLYAKNSAGTVTLLASSSGASGTVSSVAATVPSFLSIAGSPITTSGTLAISLSGTALPTTSGGTGLTSFTSGGVVYASSSSVLATGSAFQFDGTNLGLGVTPSAWGTSIRSLDIGFGTALTNANSTTDTWLSSNAYYTTQWLYKNTAPASYYRQASGAHAWFTAPSGTAGNAISFTQAMTLDASGNLGVGTTSPAVRLNPAFDGTSGSTAELVRLTNGSGGGSGTGTSLTYYHSLNTGALVEGGRIAVVKEATWTTTASTQDANMQFWTTADGTAAERFRFGSLGQFGIGGATYGTAGQILTSGGAGAAPTWTTPAAGAGTLTAVASGALANGDKVVVNSDGTVSVAAGSYSALTGGTRQSFFASQSASTDVTYDVASGKIVVVYRGSSNYPTVVVGTVSGTTISFGTAVVISSVTSDYLTITYHETAQKVVIAYDDQGVARGRAVVGTVSGTSISLGTITNFIGGNDAYWNAIVYDANADRIVIAFQDVSNSSVGTAVVGTVSGTSISFGGTVAFKGVFTRNIRACYDSTAQKVVLAYQNSSTTGSVIVGTVSGTSISFGTETTLYTPTGDVCAIAYDPNAQKSVVIIQDNNNAYGLAIVATVSGTSISVGTAVTFQASPMNPVSTVVYDGKTQKVVVANSLGGALVGTISGTSISFSSPVTYDANGPYYISLMGSTYDSVSQQVIFSYGGASSQSYAITINAGTLVTNVTASNYIGISNAAYANGATATIQIVGSVDDAQSGLTAGKGYYLQGTGTLAITPDAIPVFAGTAVSATNLIVKG